MTAIVRDASQRLIDTSFKLFRTSTTFRNLATRLLLLRYKVDEFLTYNVPIPSYFMQPTDQVSRERRPAVCSEKRKLREPKKFQSRLGKDHLI